MTRSLTYLFFFILSSNTLMINNSNLIELKLNSKTKINDSLSITLLRFSHKNPINDEQQSIESAHLLLLENDIESEVIISRYGVRGESLIENGLSKEKYYQSIEWNQYTIQLTGFKYDQSIDLNIVKTKDLTKQTIAQGKNQLIKQANQLTIAQYPELNLNPLEYEITTWANSKKVIVKYRRIIRFTPLSKGNDDLQFDFEVNLISKQTSFDTWGIDRFYVPTLEEQEKIDFVKNTFGLPRSGFDNSIIEKEDVYQINIDNEQSFGNYTIDKTTGIECMGSIEGSYEPMPFDMLDLPTFTDPLIEIRE